MAGFDYARPRATADRLLRRLGQAAVLRKGGAPSGDPWNPTFGPATDHPVQVALLAYAAADVDGTMIQANDQKVLMSAEGLGVEPQDSTDRLIVGGAELAIMSVRKVAPAGTTVLYELQCRGG